MRVAALLFALCLCASPAVLQSMRTAAADSPAAASAPNECRGMDAKRAHERADLAFQKAQYRQAGHCYLIAGDNLRADRAFVKASAAEAPATRRQLAANANQVKEQLQQFRQIREAMTGH